MFLQINGFLVDVQRKYDCLMFTKFLELQDLFRFDRFKKDVIIYIIIYIYCCYVIKYIDVIILKKIYMYIIEKFKK